MSGLNDPTLSRAAWEDNSESGQNVSCQKIRGLFLKRGRTQGLRRSVNPSLSHDQVQHKTNPKRDPEKFTRRQTGKRTRRKKHSNDRPNRSDRESHRKCPDHPLAVQRYLAPPDMPERLAQRE